MQPHDMEGKGQDLVLTSSLLTTEPSHAQSSLAKAASLHPQCQHSPAFQQGFGSNTNHILVLLLEFLRRASPREQRKHYMFGIEELKQVKTKDKPAIIKCFGLSYDFMVLDCSAYPQSPALPRTAFTGEHTGKTILEQGKRLHTQFLPTQI